MTTSERERNSTDVIVIGGGIGGVSLGYELASDRGVTLLERESTLAFHTTGRSAALFLETYGNSTIRALTTASRAFLVDPPEHFRTELLAPRPLLQFAAIGRGDALEAMYADVSRLTPDARLVTPSDARTLFPPLRPDLIDCALYEPHSMEVDVHALHQGFVRGLRDRGGQVHTGTGVTQLGRVDGLWHVHTTDGSVHTAPLVVDAAGAWADVVGGMAGADPIGLVPMRRSVFMVAAPDDLDTANLATLSDMDEKFYIKPEGTQLLCSPADETPTEPSDARPDELEIARAFDDIAEATTLTGRHLRSSWAGLRSFVPDRTPVVGFDPSIEGFFWCAGQGGYGIQTCAALARVGAAIVRGEPLPIDVTARGLRAEDLAPQRFG
ncbi:FAD-dependent oxidoreductase [Rhodococcus sp. 05-2255-3B1]|uniref:NAD(P)/FAD-dependent oxidoreductase n=1 Tax=unclassified Rhodococcus (in: high G+C Gram-positive bacteria) TaxID=192944 RepID=UPI000B9A7391|nr:MULTISPECIES: FAD-binding oxidoreductase [unclassified Rhodococcus (in: high G+C Gram-positive bacteria)]OZE08809.1 FAD-dependent oxidoreductase [Rhodococcus sp. 05-2255-3B1]OZE10149.1 FAD-dependent oxidoreductase [Rhodococcus sp. 05-2255-3C]OZE25270.1 FAD-dependent oxidoreductase [Rhodococcus sp. 05-2255-2A2]